uniref:A-kinase anchoring protein 3 n=1 Tax=Chelonoidis abingdonii TaxID=106734 RepID=A0A8C0G693_CHEAB
IDTLECALGIQDVLKSTSKQKTCENSREPSIGGQSIQMRNAPSPGGLSVYDEQFSMDVRSNNGSPDFHMEMKSTSSQKEPKDIQSQLTSADTKQDVDEVSFYVNRLSNLVIAMARKEINDKTDGTDKCIHKSLFASLGEPGHKSSGVGTDEGKNNPSENTTHINMKETKYEGNPSSKKKTFFYKEVDEQSSTRNEQNYERRSAHSENRTCHHKKRFGPDEFTNTLSKGILVYANNVVSDMMVSVMKTMKVEVNDSSIACVVLKKVILKHSKEVVSDLIDSCMKNLHNVTGTLMTDSDFVSAVKRSLFSQGSHKAAEIVQAMLNRLHTTLIVQKPAGDKSQSQSLAYASVKTGSRAADAKAQNLRFSATKTETAGLGSGEDSASGRKVVVMNQNPSESLHNKQLQALLQWVAASQTNVPVLYFLDEDDEFLNKLQQLSSIAVEKGYSVGEVIQAVLKYEKEKQLGEALGNFVRLPVLDWLLNNL